MKKYKNVMCVVMAMFISAVIAMPIKTEAANDDLATHYDGTYGIEAYWADKKVPVKEGYLFGGWYVESGEQHTALREADLKEANLSELTNVCAKFVPAYVMGVKAQMEAATQTGNGATESTYLRVITGLDSNAYQKVNFEIYYNNKIQATGLPDIDRLFSSLKNDDGEINPETTFGDEAHYFGALRINKILDDNYSKIIYVRPSWTTLDGTVVQGQGKYIRVEDGFEKNQYLSVPINLLGGELTAAGQLQMSYDATTLRIISIDAGRLMPDMTYNKDKAGVITFVGNTSNDNVTTNGLYANVRFQKIPQNELAEGVSYPSFWDFVVGNETFCNWSENITEIGVWDARY